MKVENFRLAEFFIHSEQSENWKIILATVERYFNFEITTQTENFLHLGIIISDEDSTLIQKLAKQIYGKVAPYGRVKVAITDY